MRLRLGNVLITAIAAGVGLVTLLGYFVQVELLLAVRLQFVAWASSVAAVAVWIGAFNLLSVHLKKTSDGAPGWLYSVVLVVTLIGVVGAGLIAPLLGLGPGATNRVNAWIFNYVESVIGTALSGLLVFFLVFAGYRLSRRPPSLTLIVFIVVAVLSLVGMAPLPAGLPDVGLRDLWIWLAQVPAVAGARGLLLGIALGVVATGLRILLALDRPYGE